MLRQLGLIAWLIILIGVVACRANNDLETPPVPVPEAVVETETDQESTFIVRDDQQEALTVEEQTVLKVGEGVTVAENGQAIMRLGDLLMVELFKAGEITLADMAADSESTQIVLRQNGGILLGDFQPERDHDHLTIETEVATITTAGGRFLVVSEADTSLNWVVNLGLEDNDVGTSDIEVIVDGDPQLIPEHAARWLAPTGAVSERIAADQRRLQAWLNNVQRGEESLLTLSEVLLSPANTIGKTEALSALPAPGSPFTLEDNQQGAVQLTLDPVGIFGNPTYRLEDCNGDGTRDIVLQAGKLRFDFRQMIARVLAVDVTVVNRDQPDNGALWAAGPSGEEIAREIVEAGTNQSQTLSLRSNQPYHTAELVLSDGCFLGFSLTPPTSTGAPSEPRPAATVQPEDVVVNILAEPEREISNQAELEASPLGDELRLDIDGDQADWDALIRQTGLNWTRFDTITFDQNCTQRYPESGATVDLSGQVRFAYDDVHLYVAFQVEDDGYAGYSGDGENYFLGDSPQLSLDMDLQGDINDSNRSADDWQVDFLPDPGSPRVALWQLGTLSSRLFDEAEVAVTFTSTGYFLEAALPWQSFGGAPQPGDRLGLAANINDNDTPGSNIQECIISTAPEREWNVPTTWGTLLLRPDNQ